MFISILTHFNDFNNYYYYYYYIIRFIYAPTPHSGEVICNVLYDCLMGWDIDRKVSTVTVDNYAANNAMVNILLENFPKFIDFRRENFSHALLYSYLEFDCKG